jgi:hypothetical protein
LKRKTTLTDETAGHPAALSRLSSSAVVLFCLVSGCSHAAEQLILKRFFDASRLRDRTALGSMATVVFEPSVDGIISTFTITEVGPTETRPLSENPAMARVAALSLVDSRDVDVTRLEGVLSSENVVISAPVQLPDGQVVQKTVTVVLAHALVQGARETTGRWIVTGFSAYAR